MIPFKRRRRECTPDQPAHKKNQEEYQRSRGMRCIFINPKKIGEIIDERKTEQKKQDTPFFPPNRQHEYHKKNRDQGDLEGLD
jgi:hypothetical protein